MNYDLALLDQDGIHKKKRKKLCLICLAPAMILLLLGLFFLRPCFNMIIFNINFNSQNFEGASSMAELQNFANIIQPYLADYNVGTAKLAGGQYTEAQDKLESSLQQKPSEEHVCMVRNNLGVSIEKQGDALVDNKNYLEAVVKYREAQAYLLGDNCADKNDRRQARDEKSQESYERIEEKIQEANQAANSTPDESKDKDENTKGNANQTFDPSTLDKTKDEQATQMIINNKMNGGGSGYCSDYSDACY